MTETTMIFNATYNKLLKTETPVVCNSIHNSIDVPILGSKFPMDFGVQIGFWHLHRNKQKWLSGRES